MKGKQVHNFIVIGIYSNCEKHHAKIYFDCGYKTVDAFYPPIQKKVDDVMKSKGYNSKNWTTRYFPGKDHSEKSWNERLDIPLRFLFKY